MHVLSRFNGKYYLKKGVDTNKDQTYFLWRLPQSVLRRTIFPLGELTKPEVRQIAFDAGYEKLSKKAESQEICFVPDNDYREFLRAESSAYNEIMLVEREWLEALPIGAVAVATAKDAAPCEPEGGCAFS